MPQKSFDIQKYNRAAKAGEMRFFTVMDAGVSLPLPQPPHFDHLLLRLDVDRGRSWQLYDALWQRLVQYFERRGHHSEAWELADKVLESIERKCDLEAIDDISRYAFGVARNVGFRAHKARAKTLRGEAAENRLKLQRGPDAALMDCIHFQEKLRCLSDCLDRWPERDRSLILQYYSADIDRKNLAQATGLTAGALRIKMSRLLSKLRFLFKERGFDLASR